MTYRKFRNDYEFEIVDYKPTNQFGETVHYLKFMVVDLESDVIDYYTINNSCIVAEPEKTLHPEHYSIGLHLRNEADKFIEQQRIN